MGPRPGAEQQHSPQGLHLFPTRVGAELEVVRVGLVQRPAEVQVHKVAAALARLEPGQNVQMYLF